MQRPRDYGRRGSRLSPWLGKRDRRWAFAPAERQPPAAEWWRSHAWLQPPYEAFSTAERQCKRLPEKAAAAKHGCPTCYTSPDQSQTELCDSCAAAGIPHG